MSIACKYAADSRAMTPDSEKSAMAVLPVLTYSLPFSVPGNPTDRKAIHYYHNVAATSLSGFKLSDFWFQFVLQRSEAEPIIRMAVIALSHAHLNHSPRPIGLSRLSFIAGRHQSLTPELQREAGSDVTIAYNRAIRKLRLYMQNEAEPCHEVVLLCAVLFYIIDTLRLEFVAAAKHAENGIAIMSQWRKDLEAGRERETPSAMGKLLSMYAALDLGAAMSTPDRPPRIHPVTIGSTAMVGGYSTSLSQPDKLVDAEHAQAWSINLSHGVWSFLNSYQHLRKTDIALVPDHIVEEKRELETGLRRWDCAAEKLKRSLSMPKSCRLSRDEQDSELMALAVGEAQFLCAKWLLAESLQDDDCDRHSCDEDAERAFAIAERFVQLMQQRQDEDAKVLYASRIFTSFGHSVQSLLILLHRTRVPGIRAKAVALVKRFGIFEDLSSFRHLFPDWDAPEPKSMFHYERPTQHAKARSSAP